MNIIGFTYVLALSLAVQEIKGTNEENKTSRDLQTTNHDIVDTEGNFRIKSFLSSSADTEWCVEVAPFTRLVILNECQEDNEAQIWKYDEFGRLTVLSDKRGCMYAIEPITSSPSVTASSRPSPFATVAVTVPNINARSFGNKAIELTYESCGEPEETNRFSYNIFDNTLGHLFGFLSVMDDNPLQNLELSLLQRDLCLVGQQWILEPVTPNNLIKFSGETCHEKNGCPLCTGDCGTDHDCALGLRCAKRDSSEHGRENVPGCIFKSPNDPERFYDYDFCFQPIELPGVVNYVGSCDPHSYLCNECEGDCSNNHDCADGLKCFYRSAYEGVPGCTGEAGDRDMHGKNICYDPSKDIANIRWGNRCRDNKPCDVCTGNCRDDNDCKGDLRCAQRDSGIDVPGCRFKPEEKWLRNNRQHNYCFMPELFPANAGIVNYVGECGANTYLCKRCEGNCNTDADCEGGLKCRERHGFESVPGCFEAGGRIDMEGKNICVDVGFERHELRSCPFFFHKCPECTVCDNDHDCEGHLRCAIRHGIEDVPGCKWGHRATMQDFFHGTNYCFMPLKKPGKVNYVGECSRDRGGYLCNECEGNCKYDTDCKPGLKCMYRSAFEEVPGCADAGGDRDVFGKGICFDPNFIEPTSSPETCSLE